MKFKNKFTAFLFLLFTAVTSLGPFNPFSSSYDIYESGNSSSPISLAVQGAFIAMLCFSTLARHSKYGVQKYSLYLLVTLFAISSTMMSSQTIPASFWVLLIKFILCVILYLRLPIYISRHPNLIYWSMAVFALVSIIISTLFIFGFLDSYMFWAGGRASLFGENANSYSTRMACSAMFLFFLILENPLNLNKWRYPLLIAEFPLFFTIMASGSRGSFIVVFLCLALYILFFKTKNAINKCIFTALMFCAIILTIHYISENNTNFSLFDRLTSTIETGDDAGRTRLSFAAKSIFFDNFLFGVGAPEFTRQMLSEFGLTHTVHNMYWYVAATTGVFGLLAFLLFLVSLGIQTWISRYKTPFAFVLYVAMLLIGSKTGGALTYVTMWYIFAIAASFSELKQLKHAQ